MSEPRRFKDYAEAIAYVRKSGQPQMVRVGDEETFLYPTGKFAALNFTHRKAERQTIGRR